MEDKALLYAAIFGFLGAFVTAGFAFLSSVYLNRAEKKKTAEVTVENVLTKHLDFKDDVIEYKDEVIARKDARIERLEERCHDLEQALQARDLSIRELREQLHPEKRDLDDG